MGLTHEQLYKDVIKALDKLFNDTTVSLEETMSSLCDIQDHVSMLQDALENDMK